MLITYGRVPFFFYLLQWVVAHSLALAAAWLAANRPYLFSISARGFAPPADGIGFGFRWCISCGCSVGPPLPALPVVRRREGEAPRLVARYCRLRSFATPRFDTGGPRSMKNDCDATAIDASAGSSRTLVETC